MSTSPASGRSAGTSFVELMVAISVIAIALMVMLTQISISFREASSNEHHAFAYRKAMAMLAEVQNGVERGGIADSLALDNLGDEAHNVTLTTIADPQGDPLLPDHPMSGNQLREGQWLWSRVLSVEQLPQQPQLRYVRVKVYRLRESSTWDLQATVGALVSLEPAAFQSTKHYDVYLLALGEAPSLWLPLSMARALVDNARIELQTIDNGLKLRLHWITRLGYGRDSVYTPYLNTSVASDQAAPGVYWYPGLMAGGSGDLYSADFFTGRLNTDEGVVNDYDAGTNPHPHAVADQFNHCMRLPEARALFNQRVAAGLENENEPPLQILLEDIWSDPERYRNAIFVNLHGPALPMPPLRNYSDAAKDPVGHPGVRVVTHPENLWTERDASDWESSKRPVFRVYAYKTDPDTGPTVLSEPITLQIMGVDLTSSVNSGDPEDHLQIRRIRGGVDPDTGLTSGSNRNYTSPGNAPTQASASGSYEMSYEVGYVSGAESYTWIKLHNTPLVAPLYNNEGLPVGERLYGMEYIPSPIGAGSNAFDDDLEKDGSSQPKNTARWEIQLPERLLSSGFSGGYGGNADQVVTVVTRIGDDFTTGVTWPSSNEPHNRSTTYTWWASSPDAVPLTERFQMQGDPRHNPYADLMDGGASFPHGYNWHFDDLRESLYDATVKWPGLDSARLQDGFGAGCVADAPRLLKLLRDGLQRSGAIFVHPCGPMAQGLVMGGEIALPGVSPGEPPAPVSVHGAFLGTSGAQSLETISPSMSTSPTVEGKQVVLGTGSDPFWAMDWLGELFPDSAYSEYSSTGNLTPGSIPGTFHREPRSEAVLPRLPSGTDLAAPSGSTLGLAGAVAMLDSGSLTATFLHQQETSNPVGAITVEAQDIADATGDELPAVLPSEWPFNTNLAFPGPLPYFAFTTDYPKSVSTVLEEYYNGISGVTSAGTLAVEAPSTVDTAFYSVLGVTPSTSAEHATVAMASLMLGLRSFHRAGESAVTGRVVQTPQVELIEPESGTTLADPSSLLVRWKTDFLRFDGNAYTSAFAPGFVEAEADLVYSILYSRDEGETWRYALNSQPAEPEVRPTDPALLLSDSSVGSESFVLPTPSASYVGAEYLLRIECYHSVRQTHLSAHQIRVLLTR